MNDIWNGLEDCIELLKTGRYEVLTRSEDGQRFIFPKTEPELISAYERKRDKKHVTSLEDFSVFIPKIFRKDYWGWEPTDDFILHAQPNNLDPYFDEIAYVGRFSYEPGSREFLPATIRIAHSCTIKKYGSYPFNHYVRGIYVKDKKLILIRAYYNPLDEKGNFDRYKEYDPEIDKVMTLNTIDMLADNGLPEDVSVIIRANNYLINNTCLKEDIGFI